MRLLLLVAVFVAFTAYTLFVMVGHGFLGFLALAEREPWALQLLVDLLVMLTLFATWIWRDARERKLPAWPYMILTVLGGSMGALVYLLHREIAARRTLKASGDDAVTHSR